MNNKEKAIKIYDFVKEGNIQKIQELIGDSKELLNYVTPFGTWIHVATSTGNLELVKHFIEEGVDVNIEAGISDAAAIETAASEGHIEIIKYLLENGAKLDVSDPSKNPLFSAIISGHKDVVEFLVEKGIDITVKYRGRTIREFDAYDQAKLIGKTEIAEYLKSKTSGESDIALLKEEIGYGIKKEIGYKWSEIKGSKFNFNKFRDDIYYATKKGFLEELDNNRDKTVYGYSLGCHEFACEVYAVANNKNYLSEHMKRNKENLKEYIKDFTSTERHNKFYESGWDSWQSAYDEFEEIGKYLTAYEEEYLLKEDKKLFEIVDSKKFLAFRENLINCCIEVLIRLKDEQFFIEHNPDLEFINVHVSGEDWYINKNRLDEIFEILNEGEIVEEFKKYSKDL